MLCRRNPKAFTIVELLVVVAIIALLVGIMVPAVQKAFKAAKDGVVKTQFHNIDVGLTLFKQEAGDYPPSSGGGKHGAQLLCDFLVGEDLRGYDPTGNYGSADPRRGPYIKLETGSFFPWNGTYVLKCQWGTPILYYVAASGATLTTPIDQIYDATDNDGFITAYTNHTVIDPLADPGTGAYEDFYEYITNPQISGEPLPYNTDTFILVSAGEDGIYGNDDDIVNFDRKDPITPP